MKLVINSTDFSTIGTAIYYNNSKFLPGWNFSDTYPETYTNGGTLDMPNDLGCPREWENTYFGIDENRYYAFTSPELFASTITLDKNNYKYSKVYYHGSKDKILERDFAEYDFSFLVDKYKFNDNLKIQLLDNESKGLIGYKVEELSKLENILFPSIYNGTSSEERNYFGTTVIGTYTLFLFPVPAGVRKVELYEGTILDLSQAGYNYDYRNLETPSYNSSQSYIKNKEVLYEEKLWKAKRNVPAGISMDDWDTYWEEIEYHKPCLSIYLGPDYMWSACDSSLYLTDPLTNPGWDHGFRYLPTSKKYLKGMDEVTSEKILWMVITDSGQILDINLSYNSWSTDKVNPERNKWKYSLRNDEFGSTKDNMSLLKDKSGILLDGRSNTILSTEKVETHPILSRKMRKFDLNYYDEDRSYITGEKVRYLGKLWKALQNVPAGEVPEEGSEYWTTLEQVYSPYCTYRLGERVLFNGEVWESLCDLNLGNRPDCSRQWILRDSTTNFFTTRVNVIVNPSGAGRITPGGQIRIDGEKVFSVYETLGYELENVDKACSSETGSYLSDVSIETDSVAVEGGIMDRKKVRIGSTSVEPILNSGKLIFNFKATPTIITINGMYGDNLYQYSAWNFNNERIKLTSTPSGTVSNTLSINPGTTLILSPSTTLVNNKFTKVMSTYTDRYGVTRVKQLPLSGNTVEDFIDFSSATYTFYIEKNEVAIDCTIGLSEFEMEDNRIEVDYNESGYFRFYPRTSQGSHDIVVSINDTDTISIHPDQTLEYSRTGTPRTIPGVCSNYVLTPVSGYYELRFDNLISDVNIELSYDN